GRRTALRSQSRAGVRRVWQHGAVPRAVYPGTPHGGRHRGRAASLLHRAGYDPPRRRWLWRRVDLTLFPDLLLQPEQAADPELRRACPAHARDAGDERCVERRGALALCAARCRRDGGTAALAAPT